jgi:hypothetical protein
MFSGAPSRKLAMHDQGDEITDALDRLHAGGWSIGDTAFHDVERREHDPGRGRDVRRVVAAVGMLPGRPRPSRE